ncbi:MAG: hypothetical protein ACLSHG_13575 [Oscillospiraceae bacterium]
MYQSASHRIVPVSNCMIEDTVADQIIVTIRGLLKSFKIRPYDEETGRGTLRHVLVRRGWRSGEILVVLVTAHGMLPGKRNFVRALLQRHPDITTIVQNINAGQTSLVLRAPQRGALWAGLYPRAARGLHVPHLAARVLSDQPRADGGALPHGARLRRAGRQRDRRGRLLRHRHDRHLRQPERRARNRRGK